MSESVKTEAKKPVKPVKPVKAPAKKPVKATKTDAKKSAKKTVKSAASDSPKTFFADKSKPVKMSQQRLLILKAMKGLKATSADNAATAEAIAEKAKNELIAVHTVQHYLYKNGQLHVCGFTSFAPIEEHRGLGYYLTPKGLKACGAKIGDMI